MKQTIKRMGVGIGIGLLATISLLAAWPLLLTQSGTLLYAAAVLLCVYAGPVAAALPMSAILLAVLAFGSPLMALAALVLIVPPVAAGVYTVKQPVPVERGVLGTAVITLICFAACYGILWLDAAGDPMKALFASANDLVLGMGDAQLMEIGGLMEALSALGFAQPQDAAQLREQYAQASALVEEAMRNELGAGIMASALSAGGYMTVFGALARRKQGKPTAILPELPKLRFKASVLLGLGGCTLVLYILTYNTQTIFGGPYQAVWRILQWLLAVQGVALLDHMLRRGGFSSTRRYVFEAIAFFVVPTAAVVFGTLDALTNPRSEKKRDDSQNRGGPE